MAKKFGRFVLFSALAGAAAAGTYYYLQKKQDDPLKDIDTSDDFDDFDDDFDDDTEDTASESHTNKNRSYVSLDLDSAKEIIGEKVIETIDKTKEKIENFNVSEKLDKAKEIIEEMTQPGDEFKSSEEAQPEESTEAPKEAPSSETLKSDEAPAVSVSATYSNEENEADSEEFFDDTDEED